jgi:hypothetical protein
MSAAGRTGSGACPSYFRALCRTATDGTTGGYRHVGAQFIGGVASIIEGDADDQAKLDELAALVGARDDAGTLAWFDRELPRCMALIPARRRHQFLAGIYQAVHDEQQDVFVF